MYCSNAKKVNKKNSLLTTNKEEHNTSSLDKQLKDHHPLNKKSSKIVISVLFSCWVLITIGLWAYSADVPTKKSSELKNPPFDDSLILGQIEHQSPKLHKWVSK